MLSLCGRTSNKKLLSRISLEMEWNLFRSVLASTLKFPIPKSTMLALNGTDISEKLDSKKRYYF